MNRIIFFLFYLMFFASITQAQHNFHQLSGYVYDNLGREPIVGAVLHIVGTQKAVETNTLGFYSISLPKNEMTSIEISYVGYEKMELQYSLTKDSAQNISLVAKQMQEVVVRAEPKALRANVSNIPVERLKSIPMLLGQPDLIKALAFIPGVSTGVEGSTGLFVRGGTPDQNLILLDGATVYNASHLFGFQSVFDPSAIKDVKLIKGGFPARYGSRLSSVIDITMKEGNNQKRHHEFTLGLINSGFMTEGPIKKNTSSYMISGRTSYWGVLLLPTYIGSGKKNNKPFNTLLSNDLNIKLNHEFKNKDKLFLSYYQGDDHVISQFKSDKTLVKTDLGWGNKTASLRYIHQFGQRLYSSTLLNCNHYKLREFYGNQSITDTLNEFGVDRSSQINDLAFRQQFSFSYGNNNILIAGIELNRQVFNPNKVIFTDTKTLGNTSLQSNNIKLNGTTAALYLEQENHWGDNFTSNIGLRQSNYITAHKTYSFVEPRIGLAYNITPKAVFSASYAFTTQFIQLLSNNVIGLNSDIWVPSTDLIKPQTAHLYTIGYTQQMPNIGLEFSVESYYKAMKHQIDYRQGISFFDNVNLDWQKIVEKDGIGKAYGLELMVRKEAVRYNGWLSYTLSKSERQFENINRGAWYPHKYDRLHNLNLTFEYKINKKWSVSSNFVYQTGSRVTLPSVGSARNTYLQGPLNSTSDYFPYGVFYSGRNNQRLPDYHRMDIGFSKHYLTKRKHRQATLTLGVYNVYVKANPYTLRYTSELVTPNNDPKQSVIKPTLEGTSLFTFIPSISYNLKW
jgi:hypothetical protein